MNTWEQAADHWERRAHNEGLRADKAEAKLAAAAAQALLDEAAKWDGPDHRVWKPSQVAAELRRAAEETP